MSANTIIFSHFSSHLNIPTYNSSNKSTFFSRRRSKARHNKSTVSANLEPTLMDFPHMSNPQRTMMADLVSTVEMRLDPQLLPCTLPHDVRRYGNESGTSQASLHIRSGHTSSQIDFMLGSWIHSELPNGESLDITSLSLYLKCCTDAPNFLMDMIQSNSTSLILLLDLKPRKDLVLHLDYLKTFYEDSKLESQRQSLSQVPEVKPFFSPTAIMVRVEAENAQRLEEIMKDDVHPVAKEVLIRVWLDECACSEREVSEEEKDYIQKRDKLSKIKTIEVELGSSLPRLFGSETAKRVLDVMRQYFLA